MPKASRDFLVFAKPGGSRCNLDCRYCYYLGTSRLYGDNEPARMSGELLERYITEHLEASPGETVTFAWHGGEPTVLGLEYFRTVVALQRKHQPRGRRIVNGIQTNGLLVDDEWCRFFAAESFLVGVSLDGPADLHDCYRVTRGQAPTHAHVVRAFNLLQRHRVSCDVLCVVHDENVRSPLRVYRFFRSLGVRALTFLPLVERDDRSASGVSARSVPPDAYGRFLCAIFDEWVTRDASSVAVQLFDEATRPARGLDHSLCIFRPACGDMPVVERNGDVYACDHYVDAEHRIGNIQETSLAALVDDPAERAFGDAKRDRLPRQCRACDVLAMCNGGCPKDRFIESSDGEPGLNYLCAGLKQFFTHVQPYARRLAADHPARPTLDQVLRAGGPQTSAAPAMGRNDPCPCGSGKKFKKCCMLSPGHTGGR